MGWRSPDYEPQGDRGETIAAGVVVVVVVLLVVGWRLHDRGYGRAVGHAVAADAPMGR